MSERKQLILLSLILVTQGCGQAGGGSSATHTPASTPASTPPAYPDNAAPTAADATILFNGPDVYEGTLPGTDPDGDPVTFELIRSSGPFDLLDATSGAFTYTPVTNTHYGEIVYRIIDDGGLDDLATLTMVPAIRPNG